MSVPERIDEVSGPSAAADGGWPSRAALPAQPPAESSNGLSDAASGRAAASDDNQILVRNPFASHPLPMLVYDVETLCVLDVNDATTAWYGYSRDEFLGMHITRLLPPEDVPALLNVIRQTMRPGRAPYRPSSFWRHVFKDGQVRDVEVAAHDYNLDGREAVLVTITDVTDRLRAERERDALLVRLRQEATEKAAILEQMADAVLVADGNGRIVLANRAAHDLFGIAGSSWPRHGSSSSPWSTLPWSTFDADGTELAPADRPFARALRGEMSRAELRIVTASGRESWVSASASPLRDELGHVTGLVWLGREMTEERSRREREARGEKLRALGQMASGVAHDLNQYLGLVAGYGDLTTRALDGPSPNLAAARGALEVVVRAAMDGSVSVKRLLAFARPAQDGTAEVVEVGELLREVAALTAPRWRDAAQQQGGSISMTLDIVGDTTIKGWPSALRDALTNLVFNAIDALPHGGKIHMAAHQRGDQVVASVADDGVGIPQEVLKHVFEPFFTTKGERGTGLGLAIVYGVVERHQGIVSIASPPNRGTTVTLSLPAAIPTATPALPPPLSVPLSGEAGQAGPDTPTAARLRVLVVDDEPTITRMVAMMLGPHGHDITIATSGEEALIHLADADTPFDLILSDLGLGDGMNGWDLLDRVRECAPDTRFILSTGWGAQIDPADVIARGGEALLAKPYRLSDLLEAIAGPS